MPHPRARGASRSADPAPAPRLSSRPRRPSHRPPTKASFDGPYRDHDYIVREFNKSAAPLKDAYKDAPKGPLNNFYQVVKNKQPTYSSAQGTIFKGNSKENIWRTTIQLDLEPPITAVGDSTDKKQSTHLAALSALYQLHELRLLDAPKRPPIVKPEFEKTTLLSNGTPVDYEKARNFMDFYCRRFGFDKPEIDFTSKRGDIWEAVMTVGQRRIGMGTATNKRHAQLQCYLDVTQYLESCDPDLWTTFAEAAKSGKDLGLAPSVALFVSSYIEGSIEEACHNIRQSALYKNRPSRTATHTEPEPQQSLPIPTGPSFRARQTLQSNVATKSESLLQSRQDYLRDPRMEKMRNTRATLPVFSEAKVVLDHIATHDVTILMAATGSGKTTQIPQMILDDYIERGEGAKCNIICTQPRRIAAISVADRVAKERGEPLGKSIGYHVRFESRLPDPNGCITFCTTGVFLKRLQTILSGHDNHGRGEFENLSHIVVDEVHERDVDTDLLLVVLKQLMALKRSKNQPLKVVLMSATIDPTLFQTYFPDATGSPARTISIPGRSFPVTKSFIDDFAADVLRRVPWVANQESVVRYIHREVGATGALKMGLRGSPPEARGDLDLPYPFIAATISHVLQSSTEGHVLVFLPGWDEIAATQKALLQPLDSLGVNFNTSKYSLHLLHSSIPLAEQQVIFDPPAPGVRRVILATNIAETSVTIPDVVYVIDTAKIKEQQYDPDRHMSSLVSAWVGSSNLNQRAGRAGRHRSGEYYGIIGKARVERLHPHQTVEMKRTDLSNVVMHVKALNMPGMTVEDVLARTIEPPATSRVESAIQALKMVGALDAEKNLTSLGRVLLQLPVDIQVGRLVLYGCFFRCLDQALTLAAILTNREPFLSPMHVRQEAQRVKNSWSPDDFRSDALATLRAFNSWWEMQSRGEYVSANRFCQENFLSKPTLLLIQKVRGHLLQALYRAGVIEVSAGGVLDSSYDLGRAARNLLVPPALNANGDSLPLLTALIAIAGQPKFAIRTSDKGYRTSTDKFVMIHPSSVNNRKREATNTDVVQRTEKQLLTYVDKRRNETTPGSSPFLVTTTRLDPLSYILFGAYNVEVVTGGLECDQWLPVKGDIRTLDDVWCLKVSMEACMLRVFEGIIMSRLRRGQKLPILPRERDEESSESGDEEEDMKSYALSREEMRDLDMMTATIVNLLNAYGDERIASQSVQNSRAGTPLASPFSGTSRLPGSLPTSGYTTPFYQSRPGTPSKLRLNGWLP